MFRVLTYIHGINNRTYYSGEMLPDDYIPPKDYIDNKIVEEIQGGVIKESKNSNITIAHNGDTILNKDQYNNLNKIIKKNKKESFEISEEAL